MSVKIQTDVFRHSKTALGTRLVMLAIADNADDDTREGWPSIPTIMEKANLSESAVHRAIRRAVHMGELTVVERPRPGARHQSNVYHIVDYAIGCQNDTLSVTPTWVPPETPLSAASDTQEGAASGTRTISKEPSENHTQRARRWRVCPPDEVLSEARIRIGLEAGLRSRSQVERQWLIFRGHEFASPRSDVDRTWQNWCLKEADWKADEMPSPGPPAADPEKAKRRQQADVEYEAAKERSRQRAREADCAQAERAQQATQRVPAAPERLGSVLSRLAAAGGKHADSA